jgi:hypothetical protein
MLLDRLRSYHKNKDPAVVPRKFFQQGGEQRATPRTQSEEQTEEDAMKQKEAALRLDAAMRSVDEEGIALTRREEEEATSVAEGRRREEQRGSNKKLASSSSNLPRPLR